MSPLQWRQIVGGMHLLRSGAALTTVVAMSHGELTGPQPSLRRRHRSRKTRGCMAARTSCHFCARLITPVAADRSTCVPTIPDARARRLRF